MAGLVGTVNGAGHRTARILARRSACVHDVRLMITEFMSAFLRLEMLFKTSISSVYWGPMCPEFFTGVLLNLKNPI